MFHTKATATMEETNLQLNRSAQITPFTPITRKMTRELVSLICVLHRAEQSEEINRVYHAALCDLTIAQGMRLLELIPRETKFWPSPRLLRELLDIPSIEDQRKAEQEAEFNRAKKDMQMVMDSLRKNRVHRELPQREKWIAAQRESGEKNLAEGEAPIYRTILNFGGTLECAVDMLCEHPQMRNPEEDRPEIGFTLSALDRLEKRWYIAWKEAHK